MAEVKHILILANSVRAGKHCVAGKIATPLGNQEFRIRDEWIRLNDPRDPEGAVPYQNTRCKGSDTLRPLDLIEVDLQAHCGDIDHPEDWHFEPGERWRFVRRYGEEILADVADTPSRIWSDGAARNAVGAGYVRSMNKPATLYLVSAIANTRFEFWKEWNPWEERETTKRKLFLPLGGLVHEFSVTDAAFTNRHRIYDRARSERQTITFDDPSRVYFCLSLTKITEKFAKHYKICATVFEA